MTGLGFRVIEPFAEKLRAVIRHGRTGSLPSSPVDECQGMYGSEEDLNAVGMLIQATMDKPDLVLVDYTPVPSFGSEGTRRRLSALCKERPFFLVVREGLMVRELETYSIPLLICDRDLQIVEVHPKACVGQLSTGLLPGSCWLSWHQQHVEAALMALVKACLVEPGGENWVDLPDGARANLWVDVKYMLGDPDVAFETAYHKAYYLTAGFHKDIEEDGFIVSNNNAWLLASLLQWFFPGKELVIADRLGPAARLSGTWAVSLGDRIRGKRFVIVEDVVSSGREIDLLFLLLYLYGGMSYRAVCLFDLECASPVLFNAKDGMITLCRPSTGIGYRRIPRYEAKRAL